MFNFRWFSSGRDQLVGRASPAKDDARCALYIKHRRDACATESEFLVFSTRFCLYASDFTK
jgi:hypothetical protein